MNLAIYGGLIPQQIVDRRSTNQVLDKINRSIGGTAKLVSAVKAMTSEADRKAGKIKAGQYIWI